MKDKLLIVVAAVVALGGSFPARAHEGGIDARGVVKSISDSELTVTTKHGDESFALTSQTRFIAGKRSVPRADLKVGERVVVHAKRDGTRPEAVEVRGPPRDATGGSN